MKSTASLLLALALASVAFARPPAPATSQRPEQPSAEPTQEQQVIQILTQQRNDLANQLMNAQASIALLQNQLKAAQAPAEATPKVSPKK